MCLRKLSTHDCVSREFSNYRDSNYRDFLHASALADACRKSLSFIKAANLLTLSNENLTLLQTIK